MGIEYRVELVSTATPDELKDAVERALVSKNIYEIQKVYDILNARPNPWIKPKDSDAKISVWLSHDDTYDVGDVVTDKGPKLATLEWSPDEILPRQFLIIKE